MSRAYYQAEIAEFLRQDPSAILGSLSLATAQTVEGTQISAWEREIACLQLALSDLKSSSGSIFLEYAVPRLGKRIDAVLLLQGIVFVLEFKVGAAVFSHAAIDQVWDYALDLKNFHETSHDRLICPVLIATEAPPQSLAISASAHKDDVLRPLRCNQVQLSELIHRVAQWSPRGALTASEWDSGRYAPTPTIIEAAMSLYAGHGVAEISRSDASARNLNATTGAIESLIARCRERHEKAICFVTGVPGAGKTLVGLNVATKHAQAGATHSVFLSGNGPLVAVLREALARDQVRRHVERRLERLTKSSALSHVKAFIQNVHHFRDEYLNDERAPVDHVAVFDEAQRAWNSKQTAAFMQRKKNRPGFTMSEPEFLISCLDRHQDWAVIVCLVGGGQEINTGEAGIRGWLEAIERKFPHWQVHVPAALNDSEYGLTQFINEHRSAIRIYDSHDLHLGVSMRSFRAEHVASLVKQVLDLDANLARATLKRVLPKYPIVLSRSVSRAKDWIRAQARGTERYGVVVSSQAQRLRPHAIDVRSEMDPVHWFLDEKDDVRSSFFMEDVATEFHVQGLELDWACVVWDGDFRRSDQGWSHHAFVGSAWQRINSPDRRLFQKNAYRVLLTRARQGMAIVVPDGSREDPTRDPEFYDATFHYLESIGIPVL